MINHSSQILSLVNSLQHVYVLIAPCPHEKVEGEGYTVTLVVYSPGMAIKAKRDFKSNVTVKNL